MSSLANGAGLALALFTLSVADGVHADTPPNAWDVAREPGRRAAYEIHVKVDRLLHASSDSGIGLDNQRMRALRLEAAKALLEEGMQQNGERSARLRTDLGVVLEAIATLQQRDELHRQAVDLLAPLANAPGGFDGNPAPLEALAAAYAWLDRPVEEVPIWRRYVDELTDPRRRISPLVNLGEAEMRLGDLTKAISEFRTAIEGCEKLAGAASLDADYALALWDLAVARDREGNGGVALAIVRRAKRWTWLEEGPLGLPRTVTGWDIIQDHVDVYFVPAWEREWYLALGEAADADAAPDVIKRASAWAAAEGHWKAYLAGAESTDRVKTRWAALARLRLGYARTERGIRETVAAALLVRSFSFQRAGVTLTRTRVSVDECRMACVHAALERLRTDGDVAARRAADPSHSCTDISSATTRSSWGSPQRARRSATRR